MLAEIHPGLAPAVSPVQAEDGRPVGSYIAIKYVNAFQLGDFPADLYFFHAPILGTNLAKVKPTKRRLGMDDEKLNLFDF